MDSKKTTTTTTTNLGNKSTGSTKTPSSSSKFTVKAPSLIGQNSSPGVVSGGIQKSADPAIKKQISADLSNHSNSSAKKTTAGSSQPLSSSLKSSNSTIPFKQAQNKVSTEQVNNSIKQTSNNKTTSNSISAQKNQIGNGSKTIEDKTLIRGQKPATKVVQEEKKEKTTALKVSQPKPSSNAQNSQPQYQEIIKDRFIIQFKDEKTNKEFSLVMSICESMLLIIEDSNKPENVRKQFQLDLKTQLYPLLQAVKQNEEVIVSTQSPINMQKKATAESIKDLLFQLLSMPPSRKIFFTFAKINEADLIWTKKEDVELLKMCLQGNINSKDMSKDGLYFLEQLGKGGQGEVWLYYDSNQKKTLVFKKYFNDGDDCYSSEKRVLMSLKDSNICPPLLRFDDNNQVLLSEKGELSLNNYDDYLKIVQKSMYTEGELLYLFQWLVQSVQTLWRKYSIFHCDIKPDNIVLVPSSFQMFEIRLIDFGGAVNESEDYPGCYTPLFSDSAVLQYTSDQLTEDACMQCELYCVARTLCKLALKDCAIRTFRQRDFQESINAIGGEFQNLKTLLTKILAKKFKNPQEILEDLKGYEISQGIKDSYGCVQKIQHEKLQKAQNNMGKEHLLQQIDFYEAMYAYQKGIQTIKTLLTKYTDWKDDEKKDLQMKQTRFEMYIRGITDLGNIIKENPDLMGGENKYFELLSMIAKDNADIPSVIQKSEEIQKTITCDDSNKKFLLNDIVATLLENNSAFQQAIEYRITNMHLARLLTDKQIQFFIPATQLAMCYENLGIFEGAYENYSIALESAQNLLSKDNPNLAMAYQNISNFLNNVSSFDQAEEFQKESIKLRIKGTPEYANSLLKLASIKEKMGFYKEAAGIYSESVSELRRLLGNAHQDVGYALNNMSFCLQKLGDNKQALSVCLESLDILTHHLGSKHSLIATCLANTGDCYRDLGQFKEAQEYIEKSLRLSEEISGKDSLLASNSLEKLGLLMYQQQDFTKAIEYFEKALRIRNVFSKNSSSNSGSLIRKDQMQDSNKINSSNSNPSKSSAQDYSKSTLLNNLALAYEGLMQDEKSLELQLESLEIKKNIFKQPNHPSIGISLGNIGMTNAKLARYEESVQFLQKSIDILRQNKTNKEALSTYEKQLMKSQTALDKLQKKKS